MALVRFFPARTTTELRATGGQLERVGGGRGGRVEGERVGSGRAEDGRAALPSSNPHSRPPADHPALKPPSCPPRILQAALPALTTPCAAQSSEVRRDPAHSTPHGRWGRLLSYCNCRVSSCPHGAVFPSAPPRFGAAAGPEVFPGAPWFGTAAAREVFPGAPRFRHRRRP